MASRDIPFVAGLALVAFVALDVLVGATLLIFGVTMNVAVLPAAALLAVAATAALCRSMPRAHIAAGIALAAAAAVACVAVAGVFFDIGYDGNSYQKAAIGALAHGWNPVYESIETYFARAEFDLSPITHALWADHYPKASWLFGASAYVITGSIESGKGVNLIMGLGAALVTFEYLRARFLRPGWAALVAALAVVNPVTFPQYLTNYVDGLLACTLLVIVVALLEQADPGYDRGDSPAVRALLAAAVLFCVNIKFTGFVYAGFFCGAFYVLALVRAAWGERRGRVAAAPRGRHARISEGTAPEGGAGSGGDANAGAGVLGRTFVRLTAYYLVVVAVSVLVAGSNTYLPNTIDHGSPFYPLISAQTSEIIDGYQPDSFETMNPYKKFLLSLFSKTENAWKEDVQLKLPFTFTSDELAVDTYDTRRAGFGAFFSGIFLVSGAVCVVGMVALWRRERRWFVNLVTLAVPCVALVGLTDGSWWARYTPYLWYVPLIALVLLLGDWGLERRRGARVAGVAAGVALAALMAVDVATFLPVLRNTVRATRQAEAFYEEVRALGRPVEVTLADHALGGAIYNLLDEGIDYAYVTRFDEGDEAAGGPVLTLDVVGLQAR